MARREAYSREGYDKAERKAIEASPEIARLRATAHDEALEVNAEYDRKLSHQKATYKALLAYEGDIGGMEWDDIPEEKSREGRRLRHEYLKATQELIELHFEKVGIKSL